MIWSYLLLKRDCFKIFQTNGFRPGNSTDCQKSTLQNFSWEKFSFSGWRVEPGEHYFLKSSAGEKAGQTTFVSIGMVENN